MVGRVVRLGSYRVETDAVGRKAHGVYCFSGPKVVGRVARLGSLRGESLSRPLVVDWVRHCRQLEALEEHCITVVPNDVPEKIEARNLPLRGIEHVHWV